MSALLLLSLLGLTLLIPVSTDDGNDTPENMADPEEPVDPQDTVDPEEAPASIEGTEEADVLTTASDQIINGAAGNDTLSATGTSNDAILNGGRDDDTFNLDGTNNIANGERGDDIFNISGAGGLANGDSGSDTFIVDATNATINAGSENDTITSLEDNSNAVINAGFGDDEINAAGTNITVNGDEGNDRIDYRAASGTVFGNLGDDTIDASPSDRGLSGSIFGNGGNDVLEAYDFNEAHGGVVLNGGDGDDSITSSAFMNLRTEETSQDTLTGGRGDDSFNIDLAFIDDSTPAGTINIATITDFDRGENTLNISTGGNDASGLAFSGLELNVAEDGSYTDVIAQYNSLVSGAEPTLAVVRVEGVDDLQLSDINLFTGVLPTSGNDVLSSTGSFDPEDPDALPETLSGLVGDDLLIHEASDSSGELLMDGGDGNDTLLANEVEFGNNTTLDGGAGDDVLRSDLFVTGTPGDSFDTFITGEGADRIEIITFNTTSSENIDLGLLGVVTDFTPGEDMIFVDPSQVISEIVAVDDNEEERDFTADFTHEFNLSEDTAAGFTDLEFTFTAIATGEQMTGTLRLDGLTDITEDDIAFGQLENPAPLFVRSGTLSGL
jgi:Ca2+-binding RTX toxin-like protein